MLGYQAHNCEIVYSTKRGDKWSLRAFASMPSTAIFLRARAEIKNLLCKLASNTKIWGARASEHSFKFCEQLKILMDNSSPLPRLGNALHSVAAKMFYIAHSMSLLIKFCYWVFLRIYKQLKDLCTCFKKTHCRNSGAFHRVQYSHQIYENWHSKSVNLS